MNTTNKQYSTQAIDPSILDVLDISIDGKVVSAENWKTLWELVFKHINTLDAYCVTLEELRSEWSNSKALLDAQMLDFTSKYAALEQSFVHYGESAPVNEHIKLWVQPVSNLKDKVLITFKELLATEDLLTNRINTLRDEMDIGFVALRDTLDNDYVSNTEANNKFYNKSEVDVIVNNAVSTKADVDYVNNIVANQVDNLYTYEIIDSEYDLSTDSYTKTVTITGAVEKCAVYVIPSFIEGYPVTAIGTSAFTEDDKDENGVILREVVIPDGVTRIGKEAFYGCLALETVTLPDSIVYISKAAFSSSDMVVYYGGTEEQWSRIVIDEGNNNLISPKNIYYNQKPATVDYVDSKVVADQTYIPESENAQSGKAVAKALETKADNSDVLKKQNTLVSGENIKTINGESILGSGDITIEGGSGGGSIGAEAVKEFFGDIVTLDTHARNYDTANWNRVGAKGFNTGWGDVKNRDELQVGQVVVLPGYNTDTQSPVALLGEVTEIDQYVFMTSITWFPLKNLKGASIIPFDTELRNFSDSQWNAYGAYGRQTRWDNINNKSEFRTGDIGILSGRNTTTNASVLCFGEILSFEGSNAITKTIACIQGGAKGADGTVSFDELTDAQKASLKGDTGPQGPQGPAREAVYHSYRDQSVSFELKKGRMYSFTVDNDDANSACIVDTNGKTIQGVAGKVFDSLKNGMIICADRCTGFGLTGELSITNLNAYMSDRWDWHDDYRGQYGPYYLQTRTTDGIDIWEI